MARPFKVLIPDQKDQFGVVARSLRVLRDSIQKRYGLKSGFEIFLTDGTAVDNEEYFAFLEPQTLLIVKYAIPSGDTKTSVVDLTCKELVCKEDKTYGQPHHKDTKDISASTKDVFNSTNKQPTENKNASTGTQTLAVMSIQIAKVQGDVAWESEGTSAHPNVSSAHPHIHYQQTQALVQSDTAAVTKAPSITLHHLNPVSSNPAPQTSHTYPASGTSRASVKTVFHQQPQQHQQQQQQQLQSSDITLLQQLYQQGQLQKRYHYHHHQQQHHQQQQQTLSQAQACNAVALRPSQRYYIQQYQQQVGRNRNYHLVHQLSSCAYNGTDLQQHQHLSSLPPY